ncbi:MAG: 4'-phosphopantetheinyl transferase superfamily protein [Hyphomicrobiaceae bacterium]
MLRILLAGYIGTSEARRPFEIAEGGKPSLATRTNPPLQFSLAHGDTAAIIAVSFDGPIGVDLETPRHVRIAEHRRHALIAAAASLHPERPLPTTPEDACFLQAWTRLEALAKATGEGIGAVLERVRRDETPIARTTISNRPVHVRDVTVGLASPIYAAVAGTAASIAAARHLEALPVPLERSWLEHWLAGDGSRGGLEA